MGLTMTPPELRRSVALASISAIALLAAPAAQADAQAWPFKLAVTTQESLAANPLACPLTILQGSTTGQGHALHLGQVTLRSTDCVTLGASQFTFTDGALVLVAANGDTLTADYSGALLPSAAYPVYTLSGSFRITGGSGRFSGATGAGSLTGTSNIVTGQGAYLATGTIGY